VFAHFVRIKIIILNNSNFFIHHFYLTSEQQWWIDDAQYSYSNSVHPSVCHIPVLYWNW